MKGEMKKMSYHNRKIIAIVYFMVNEEDMKGTRIDITYINQFHE